MSNSSLSAQIKENQELKNEIEFLNSQLEILKDSYNKTLDAKPIKVEIDENSLKNVLKQFFPLQIKKRLR